MAKRDAEGVPKKVYSSKLLQMKFMQRGARGNAIKVPTSDEAPQEDEAKQEQGETQWVADRETEAGCQVIYEGDPGPGSSSGRISFSGTAAAETPQVAGSDGPSKQLPEVEQSKQSQPFVKKRKKAADIKENRFDSPKIDGNGRYFTA